MNFLGFFQLKISFSDFFKCTGDVAQSRALDQSRSTIKGRRWRGNTWSIRSRDSIAIVDRHLRQGVRGAILFIGESFLK